MVSGAPVWRSGKTHDVGQMAYAFLSIPMCMLADSPAPTTTCHQGRYVGSRKEGDGVYHFVNGDVYEGEFRDDRMDGYGVYTFR